MASALAPICTAAGPRGPFLPSPLHPSSPRPPHSLIHLLSIVFPGSFSVHAHFLLSSDLLLRVTSHRHLGKSGLSKSHFLGPSTPHYSSRCSAHPLVTSQGPQGGSTVQSSAAYWRELSSLQLSEMSPWTLETGRNGSKIQICHLLIWGKLLYFFKSQFTQL